MKKLPSLRSISIATRLGVVLLMLTAAAMLASGQRADETSQRALRLLEQGKFAEAIPLLRQLREVAPANTSLQMNLANAYVATGELAAAAREFDDLRRRLPEFKPATLALASLYLNSGRTREAVSLLREFVTRVPADAEARGMLAGAYLATGDLARAYQQHAEVARMQPKEPQSWYALWRTLQAVAGETVQQVELADPESGYMVALAGFQRREAGQAESAFYLFREALKRTPQLRGIHTALAAIYREREKPEWATAEEQRERSLPALDCNADSVACAFEQGKLETVMEQTRFARLPSDLYWRYRAASTLAGDAYARLQALPPSVQSHGAQAEQLRAAGRHGEAAAAWRKAIAKDPRNLGLRKELLVSLYQAREFEACTKLADELLKQAPSDPSVQLLTADTALSLQQPARALPLLEKLVSAEPGMLPARASLGRALLLLNRAQDAIPHLERSLPMDRDGAILYQLAQAYQKAGMDARAKEAFARYQEFLKRDQAEKAAMEQQFQITAP